MTQSENKNVKIQLLKSDSIEQILSIERQVHITPWSAKKLAACFNNHRIQVLGCNYHDELIGYAVLQLIEPEAELQNFAIATHYQHQGFGRYFLIMLFRFCKNSAINKLLLEVRESNSAAINLYLTNGFKKVGIRKKYYQTNSGRESALLMNKQF